MVATEKSALVLYLTFYLNMITYKEKNASKFFIAVSKTGCSNEKNLVIGVKKGIASDAKLYGVGVIAHAKSPKMALHMCS